MKTSSCKAKGREFQQKIRDMYRNVGRGYGLQDPDVESRGMGQQGEDIILSPRARELFDHTIECKKHQRVAVPKEFEKHYKKYKKDNALKLLFHENDYSDALVTLLASDFLLIIEELINLQHASI